MHFFMITKPNSYLLICLKIMFISIIYIKLE